MLHKPLVKEAIGTAWNLYDQRYGSYAADKIQSCRRSLKRWKKENPHNSKVRKKKIFKVSIGEWLQAKPAILWEELWVEFTDDPGLQG